MYLPLHDRGKEIGEESVIRRTGRAKRRAKYKRTDHITLKWEGRFHKSLKILIFADKLVIASKNVIWSKYLETQSRFENALGLTEDNIKKARDIIRPEFIKLFRNEL